jgi:hypothetical protein
VLTQLSLKIVEIKTGRLTPLGRLSVVADPFLSHYVRKGRIFAFKLNIKNIRKFLAIMSHGVFHVVGTAGLFVSKHYKELAEKLNGRKKLENRGVVSFFLKDVAESREENKNDAS